MLNVLYFYRIFSLIKPPKVDADSGVKNENPQTELLEQDGDIEDLTKEESDENAEAQQKKKQKKEKVGFRDRKVKINVLYSPCHLSLFRSDSHQIVLTFLLTFSSYLFMFLISHCFSMF